MTNMLAAFNDWATVRDEQGPGTSFLDTDKHTASMAPRATAASTRFLFFPLLPFGGALFALPLPICPPNSVAK